MSAAESGPRPLGLGPVLRRRVSEDVRARLEAAIRDGRLSPGDPLPSERDLMAMMGVGRPAVRDALTALARLGMVTIAAGGRTRVSTPNPKHLLNELGSVALHMLEQPGGIRHFEQARMMLELGLVNWACEHATAAQLDRLKAALDQNEAAIGQQSQFVATDVAFHRVLAEMPGNPVLLALHDAAVEWLILQRPPLPDPASNNRMSHLGHAAIFASIAARDANQAASAMRSHLDEAHRRYSRN